MQLVYVDKTFFKIEGALEEIKTSKVASRALFYTEPDGSWGNSLEADERSRFDQMTTLRDFNEKKWILLKKNTFDGPYSSKEIFEMITQSKVRLRDPIWTEGQKEWQSIKNTQCFKALDKFSEPPESDAAEILSHVMEYDPEMRRVEDKNPSPGGSDEVFMILDDK